MPGIVNKDLTPKDQDKDKVLTPKDQDKNKDLTPKDKDKDKDLLDLTPKDKDKDLTPKDQDKDLKNVLKESLRTRTRINIPGKKPFFKERSLKPESDNFKFFNIVYKSKF